ncbi:YaiI/YqxD family protein [Bosea sp. RAF48]|uniref:YaiI/YqxD family protein n=1 Tax=Bosea sp. RAF48 TaxID=3237480 RepID=UPI003F9155BA
MTSAAATIAIYVDADACPVKPEIYRVAERHRIKVFVVANSFINVPREPWLERVIVSDGFDAADNWIAERVSRGDIVITSDIPLADRCIKAGADVIGSTGKPFSEASIGMALATRDMMEDLRAMGAASGGPKPFSARDRSAFLQALDVAVQRLKRAGFQVS